MPDNPRDLLLRPHEAARLLGVPPLHFLELTQADDFPRPIRPGLWSALQLIDWALKDQKNSAEFCAAPPRRHQEPQEEIRVPVPIP